MGVGLQMDEAATWLEYTSRDQEGGAPGCGLERFGHLTRQRGCRDRLFDAELVGDDGDFPLLDHFYRVFAPQVVVAPAHGMGRATALHTQACDDGPPTAPRKPENSGGARIGKQLRRRRANEPRRRKGRSDLIGGLHDRAVGLRRVRGDHDRPDRGAASDHAELLELAERLPNRAARQTMLGAELGLGRKTLSDRMLASRDLGDQLLGEGLVLGDGGVLGSLASA